jgi:hypothetical protein
MHATRERSAEQSGGAVRRGSRNTFDFPLDGIGGRFGVFVVVFAFTEFRSWRVDSVERGMSGRETCVVGRRWETAFVSRRQSVG